MSGRASYCVLSSDMCHIHTHAQRDRHTYIYACTVSQATQQSPLHVSCLQKVPIALCPGKTYQVYHTRSPAFPVKEGRYKKIEKAIASLVHHSDTSSDPRYCRVGPPPVPRLQVLTVSCHERMKSIRSAQQNRACVSGVVRSLRNPYSPLSLLRSCLISSMRLYHSTSLCVHAAYPIQVFMKFDHVFFALSGHSLLELLLGAMALSWT